MVEPEVSDGEAELVGLTERASIDGWLDQTLRSLVGSGLAEVLFVAGRIDVVYAVLTGDGRRLLVKVHRPPVDVPARRLVAQAQEALASSGFPCAEPLTGPIAVDGRMMSVETLLPEGERGDGHDAAVRMAMAEGLARHVRVLAGVPGLAGQVGEAPAWCLYERGAWAASHMGFFDFSTTPPEYEWLQQFAQEAAERTVRLRDGAGPPVLVAAHADWYGGNLRFEGSHLVAAFDWDLMADTEPVVAGITAGMFSAGTDPAATPPAPEEVDAFLMDYEAASGRRLSGPERDLSVAAACWSIAYTARCDVTILDGAAPRARSALDLLATRREDYLSLAT